MNTHHWAIGSLGALALSTALIVIKVFAEKYRWPLIKQRKCLHVCWGVTALSIPFLSPRLFTVIWVIGFSLMLHLGLRKRVSDNTSVYVLGIERPIWGDVLLCLSIIALFPLYTKSPFLYWIPISLFTLADTLVFFWGEWSPGFSDPKNWRKTIALGLSSGLMIAFILFSFGSFQPLNTVLICVTLSLLTALLRSHLWLSLDAFLIPIGSALLLIQFLHQESAVLVSQILLLMSLMILATVAKRLKILDVPPALCVLLTMYMVFIHGGLPWISPSLVLLFSHLMYIVVFKDKQKYSLEAALSISSCSLFWMLFDHYQLISSNKALFLYIFSMAIHQWFLVIIRLKYISKHPQRKLSVIKRLITFWSCSVVFSDIFLFVDPFPHREYWFFLGVACLGAGCLIYEPRKALYSTERWVIQGVVSIVGSCMFFPLNIL